MNIIITLHNRRFTFHWLYSCSWEKFLFLPEDASAGEMCAECKLNGGVTVYQWHPQSLLHSSAAIAEAKANAKSKTATSNSPKQCQRDGPGERPPNGQMLSAQQQKQLLRADNLSQTNRLNIHLHQVAPDHRPAVISSCRSPYTDGGFTRRLKTWLS